MIAASLTLLVWSTPLLRALRDTVRYQSLTLDALRPVSVFRLVDVWVRSSRCTNNCCVGGARSDSRASLGALLLVLAIASFVALLLRADLKAAVVYDRSAKFAFAAGLAILRNAR